MDYASETDAGRSKDKRRMEEKEDIQRNLNGKK